MGAQHVQRLDGVELRQLDPYKPSHADLLRQIGNGIPQWSHFSWYPNAPVPAPLMLPSTPPAMGAAAQTGATPGNVVVILVPPNGPAIAPRVSPERPRVPLPVPPQPQPRAPGSAPGGAVRARLTSEQAAETLRRLAYQRQDNGSTLAVTGPAYVSPDLNASAVDAISDQSAEP